MQAVDFPPGWTRTEAGDHAFVPGGVVRVDSRSGSEGCLAVAWFSWSPRWQPAGVGGTPRIYWGPHRLTAHARPPGTPPAQQDGVVMAAGDQVTRSGRRARAGSRPSGPVGEPSHGPTASTVAVDESAANLDAANSSGEN